jgi:putative membrane protein
MFRILSWVPVLPALAGALLILAPAGEKQEKRVQVKKETPATPQDKGEEKLTPQQFLARAIDLSLSEMDLAQKAATGSSSDKVRQFAQKLVEDHKKLTKRLMGMANDMKLGVVAGMSPEYKKAMAQILLAKGNDFDHEFLNYVVRSHEKAVKLFEQCAREKGTDTDARVRHLADDALPGLRQHLQDARALQSSMFGKENEKR